MKGGDGKKVYGSCRMKKENQISAPERDRTLHQGKKYKEECSVKSAE